MFNYSHKAEARVVLGLIALCVIVGIITGYLKIAFFAGLIVYIAYHLKKLNSLSRWLQSPKLSTLPDAGGMWGEVFDSLGRQKRREERENRRLRGIIERINATTAAINDAIIILDKKYVIGWWNQAAATMLDLKTTDTGTSLINYLRHPDFVSYLEEDDYEVPLTLPSPRNYEIQLEFQLTRFGANEILLVVRDVTRLYKLEQMRKDFVANVSHELRTPLTVIRGYLETLESMVDPEMSNHRHWDKALGHMQQQAVRMTALINDLTMLSKLETDRVGHHQQAALVQPILEMVCSEARALSAERNHRITLRCDADITLVANERELHSAISNLVTNAVKYSPPEKTIAVEAFFQNGGDLEIAVQDEGEGIEERHLGRLTERFYRVDSSRSIDTGGTGLGLAIVKHILLRHDARLDIKSEHGRGSRFSCIFPEYRAYRLEEKSGD